MTLGRGVTVELTADGSQAKTEIVGVQDSLGRLHTTASVPMGAGLQALEAAARQASSAVPELGRELQQMSNTGGAALQVTAAELEALKLKFDPAYAAAKRLTTQTQELSTALSAGAITQQQHAQLMRQMTQAHQSAGVSMGQIAQATRQLPMQMQDIFVSLQGGMSPLTVFMQQGSQIAGSYGSAGLALKSVATYLVGMVNPLSIAAAAVAALGVAYDQGSKESDAYRLALLNTGNAAGTSTAQMADMARGMGSAWGVTQGAASEALAAMASTGRVGSASLQGYAQVAIDMEKSFGVSIADTAKHFGELGKDPVGASVRLNESMNYLTASTYAQIKAAADNGDAAKAAALAQDAYAQAMKGRAAEVVANLGYMERAWAGIKNTAKETWDAMLGVGRSSTPGDALAKATKQLADREASLKEYGNRGGVFGDDTATQVAKLKDQVYGLQELERMQKRAGTAAAERAEAEKKGIAAIEAVGKANEKGVPKQEQMTKALKDYRDNLGLAKKAGAEFKPEQIKNAEAAIREQFKVAPPKKTGAETLEKQQAKTYAELVTAMQSKVEASRLEAAQTEKLTESQKQQLAIEKLVKDGKISARDASSAKTTALIAEMKAAEDLKRTEAFRKAQNDADEKALESLQKEVESIRKASAAMALHNAEIGLSTEQLHALRLARLDDEIAVQAGIVAEYDEARARGEVSAQMQLQIQKLDELRKKRGLTAEGQQAQVSADADKKATDAAKKAAEKAMADFDALTGQLDASKLNGLFNGAIDGAMKFVTALQLVGDVQDKSAAAHRANLAANGRDVVKFGEVQKQIAAQSAVATLSGYAAMAGALKGYAKEGSRTYAALQNAERVFQAFQLATTLATMAEKTGLMAAFVGAKVAGDAAMQTSGQAAGWAEIAMTWLVAKAKAILGIANQAGGDPYSAFPRIAAMTALMAGLGLLVSGGGGGGAAPTNDGTGTVFGDPTAKSESLSKSLDLLNGIQDEALVYSKAMAASLRSIEASMGGVTNVWLRSGGTTGLTSSIATGQSDTALSNFVNTGKNLLGPLGGFLSGLGTKLFGKKTTITGSGIGADAQSLGGIMTGGFKGNTYADVTTSKKFLGVTYSSKNSVVSGALDPALGGQITNIFGGIGAAVGSAAELLGQDLGGVQKKLQSYVVDIGRIDLSGLSGEQIAEKLSAVFGAEADKIAKSVIPGFESLQKVGEGYFETLTRVASQFEVVNVYMTRLGDTLGAVGVAGAVAADDLVTLFGGLDKFQSAIGAYYQDFYSESERNAEATKELGKAFSGLGLAVPDTIAAYRDLVKAQDQTTESGRETFASLIALSPAFKKVADAAEEAAKKIQDERLGLENQLLQAQGNTAELRRRERDQLDESNRALYDRIKALEDEKTATDKAAAARAAAEQAEQQAAAQREKAEQDRITALKSSTDAAYAALQKSVQAERDLAAKTVQDRTAAVAAINALFDLITNTVNTLMRQTVQGDAAAVQLANNFIDAALASVRAGGALPDSRALQDAINVATGGLDAALYATRAQEDEARIELANRLRDLRSAGGAQLSTAEKQLAEAQSHTARLDELLVSYKTQIDTMRGVDSSVKGVATAIDLLRAAMLAESRPTGASTGGTGSTGTGTGASTNGAGGTGGTGTTVVGPGDSGAGGGPNSADPNDPWYTAHASEGWAFLNFMGTSGWFYTRSDAVPQYAAGGTYPGGLALVGEAGPELINFAQPGQVYNARQTQDILRAAVPGAGSGAVPGAGHARAGGDTELRAIRDELVGLRAEVRAVAHHGSKAADILDRVTQGADALRTEQVAA